MGSSGGIPDIGVRLTAQGVQDVVNAFTRVRQEAKTTGEESAASIELMNFALETLGELLPAISIGIAVEKLVEMGVAAFESAEQLGKLAEKSGVTASALSVFNLAAAEVGVSTDSLSGGIVKLTKASQDAADGVAKPKKAFADLGITLSDLKNSSPDQLFTLVATKLSGIESPGLRAQAAVALFGKAGTELIPVLEKLGTEGFDALQQKAQFLGVYLDANLSEEIKRSKEDFADLAAAGQGAALQFDAGLLPAISGVADAIIGLAGGSDGFRQWGVGVGNVVLTVAAGLAEMVKDLRLAGTEYASLEAHINGFGDKIDAKYGFTANQRSTAQTKANADDAEQSTAEQDRTRILTEYNEQLTALASAQIKLNAPPAPSAPAKAVGGVTPSGNTAQADKDAKAYAAYQESLANNQLALLKTTNQLEEAEDKRHYDAGLLSVDDYYDKVEQRINDNSDAEINALDAKYAAAQSLPTTTAADQYKKQQTLAAIDTEMAQVNMKNVADLKAAEDDRFKAYETNAAKQLSDTEKLQKASGDSFGAQETALQIEINDYSKLLAAQGLSLEQINDATAAYQRRGQALIDFNRTQQDGSQAVGSLNSGIADIQNQAANGSITNISAQYQINQLQQDSLATLAKIGQQMFINAALSEDPKAIDAANKFLQANQKLASSITNVTTVQTQLVNQLSGQGYTDLVDFFTAGIDGSKSFADAMTDLGNQFAEIVSKMVSQLLVFYALQALLGWIAPNSQALTNLNNSGPFSSSPLSGHADGGWTGDGPTNQVTGYVHGQEYVIKAGPAAANRALLDAMNNGAALPATQTATSAVSSSPMANPATASTQYSSDDNAPPAPIVQVINTTGQQSKQTQKNSPGGQSITQIIIGAVATDIASGGQVAQALQSNYGVSRSGVKRG